MTARPPSAPHSPDPAPARGATDDRTAGLPGRPATARPPAADGLNSPRDTAGGAPAARPPLAPRPAPAP
ncbi:stress protein, partial [Streptomyces kronopolitis]|nr:stress protein [Streptomyces kronopolitis]